MAREARAGAKMLDDMSACARAPLRVSALRGARKDGARCAARASPQMRVRGHYAKDMAAACDASQPPALFAMLLLMTIICIATFFAAFRLLSLIQQVHSPPQHARALQSC